MGDVKKKTINVFKNPNGNIFSLIKEKRTKKSYSEIYVTVINKFTKKGWIYHKVNTKHITSWLLTITEIRNTCAHHEKLFDNVFKISPIKHRAWKDISNKTPQGKELFSIYAVFLVFKYITQDKELFNESIDKLDDLFNRYSSVINPSKDLKFPTNWITILKI